MASLNAKEAEVSASWSSLKPLFVLVLATDLTSGSAADPSSDLQNVQHALHPARPLSRFASFVGHGLAVPRDGAAEPCPGDLRPKTRAARAGLAG